MASVVDHPAKSKVVSADPTHPWNIISVDSDDSRLEFSGTWVRVVDGSAMGAAYKYSQTPGDYVKIKFYGAGLWVWVYYDFDAGKVDLYIDDELKAEAIDLYSPSTRKDIIWAAVGLDKLDENGELLEHSCKIVVRSDSNPSSTGTKFKLDGFEVEVDPGALQTRAIIESAISVKLIEALGRGDYLKVYEVAPWAAQYLSNPTNWGDQSWGSPLVDIKGRLIVGLHPFTDIDTTINRDALGNITSIVQTNGIQTVTSTITRNAAGQIIGIEKSIS